jgi:exodeoxyribonuclease V alpha subunit
MITTAAHEVNHGEPPRLEPAGGQEHDFFFIERTSPERALETVVEVVAERAPARFGIDPIRELQVLAPMYRGAVGIDALNERLQRRLNPDGRPALGERFRIGDRLIQTRNSHELGLMNGSIVFLREDDPEEEAIRVDTDDGGELLIPYAETATLRPAYAISVHKAQGCEVPVVVVVCHRSHARMLTRPLLYTAITRARSGCIMIGDRGALAMAVRRDDGGGRHSALSERLRGAGGVISPQGAPAHSAPAP